MNEMCDIFIMCFVLFLFVTCFGWNFNAIVVVEEEEEGGREVGGGGGLKGPLGDIAQLPVEHAHSLPPLTAICMYYYSNSNTKCNGCACAHDHFQSLTSLPVKRSH
jgi:hypothetical protein